MFSKLLLQCLALLAFCHSVSAAEFPFSYPVTTLSDTIPPEIICPPAQTITLGSFACDTLFEYTVTATDDQGQAILIRLSGLASGASFAPGSHAISWLATDLAGNTAACSFTITVEEANTPIVCKPAHNVYLDASCELEITAAEELEGGPYGCVSRYTIDVDKTLPFNNGPYVPAHFTAADIGKTYQLRVTDLGDNTDCFGNITIKDNVPPAIHCDSIFVPCIVPEAQLTPAFLRDSFGFSIAIPQFGDACNNGPVNIGFVDQFQNLPCDDTTIVSGIVRRLWTATDGSGNTGTCAQIISRVRNLADVQIPADGVTSCTENDISVATHGLPYIEFKNRRYELTQNIYCEFALNHTDSVTQIGCAANSVLKRYWKIYDACLPFSATNPKTGIQVINIKDEAGPAIQCPANMTLTVQDVNCSSMVDLPDVLVSDDCSFISGIQAFWTDNGLPKTLLGSLESPGGAPNADTMGVFGTAALPTGIVSMLYVATDACDNIGDCSFTISLANATPPMAMCNSFFAVDLDANGYGAIPANAPDNGSTDDCGTTVFKLKLDHASACDADAIYFKDSLALCCLNRGDTLQGVMRVYDIATIPGAVPDDFGMGHFSDCSFQIVVNGGIAPVCTAPADVTVSCDAFDPTFSAYGNLNAESCAVDSVSISADYSQYDTICSKGLVKRIFHVFNSSGDMGQCEQHIQVQHVQDYFVKFPDDQLITVCDTLGDYGQPEFYGVTCEKMAVTYEDLKFDDVPGACYKIERTWTIKNTCTYDPGQALILIPNPAPSAIEDDMVNLLGPVISNNPPGGGPWTATVEKVYATDVFPTDYSTFYDADANGYQYVQIIKVIDSQAPMLLNCHASAPDTVSDQSVNDPQLWNKPYWFDNGNQSHDLCEAPAQLSITATDLCADADVHIRYELFLDLDGDGTQETLVDSDSLPAVNTVMYNNLFGAPVARNFDDRPVPATQKWQFGLQEVISGRNKTATLGFNTTQQQHTYVPAQLPHGHHRIKWTVTDPCGNESTCEYAVTVLDGKAPTVVCLGPFSVNIPPTGINTLMAPDFLQYGQDNCTQVQFLKYAVRVAGTGVGFPVDGNGNPVESLTFACGPLGPNLIELWCRDLAGNAGFCQITLTINDVLGNCDPVNGIGVSGKITTETGEGVADATINIEGSAAPIPPFMYFLGNATDTLGKYTFPASWGIPPGSNFTITSVLDDNPLNGVTTYDLVLISKHILGIEALGSPYKMIAADANRSNTITTFDIVEFRKLILGIYNELPNNDSWRFVAKDYMFPNPMSPFADTFPEYIHLVNVLNNVTDADFIGVKIGDVNNTVVAHALAPADTRSAGETPFEVSSSAGEDLQAGELFDLHFTGKDELLGCQFTLNTNGLEVLDVIPGPNMSKDQFAIFPEKEAVTMAWETGGKADFTLKCRAKATGNLREMLSLGSRITRAEAYRPGSREAIAMPVLHFPELDAFMLCQNRPNPFSEGTDISFNLPEAGEATLTVSDAAGRVLYTHTGTYEKGMNTLHLEKSALSATGVLFYEVKAAANSAVRKMIKL